TDLEDYKYLKGKWKISIQDMAYRAQQLDIISDNQFEYMTRQIPKTGGRTKDPGDDPYRVSENIFNGATDSPTEAEVPHKQHIIQKVKKHGITLYREDIEQLLHLREGTLFYESSKPKIIQLKDYLDEKK